MYTQNKITQLRKIQDDSDLEVKLLNQLIVNAVERKLNAAKAEKQLLLAQKLFHSSSPKKRQRDENDWSDSSSDDCLSKKKKIDDSYGADAIRFKKQMKKRIFVPIYSAQLYFLKYRYLGTIEGAKHAFEKLGQDEIRKMQEKVNRRIQRYTSLLRSYVKTLSKDNLDKFQMEIRLLRREDEMLLMRFYDEAESSDKEENEASSSDEEEDETDDEQSIVVSVFEQSESD